MTRYQYESDPDDPDCPDGYLIPPGKMRKDLVDHIADYCYKQDVSTVGMFATLAEIQICVLKSQHMDEPTRRKLGVYGVLIHDASDNPMSALVSNFGVVEELAS